MRPQGLALGAILALAVAQVAAGQYVYTEAPRLEFQAGEAWQGLTHGEKMAYVSGVLVGCKYLSDLYDREEKPDVKVSWYMTDLFSNPNVNIVKALDRLYQVERYYKVPIIVLVFGHRTYLKELGYAD